MQHIRNLSQSRRLPLLQVVSNNKSFSVGVQSPTEINAPRGCAVILRRICQLSLTRITHQVSRAFDLNSRLCDMARDAKRVSSTLTETDNDKYAFRCFLLRLGFIGKEYKTARKILLRNLTGNSAFRYGE